MTRPPGELAADHASDQIAFISLPDGSSQSRRYFSSKAAFIRATVAVAGPENTASTSEARQYVSPWVVSSRFNSVNMLRSLGRSGVSRLCSARVGTTHGYQQPLGPSSQQWSWRP